MIGDYWGAFKSKIKRFVNLLLEDRIQSTRNEEERYAREREQSWIKAREKTEEEQQAREKFETERQKTWESVETWAKRRVERESGEATYKSRESLEAWLEALYDEAERKARAKVEAEQKARERAEAEQKARAIVERQLWERSETERKEREKAEVEQKARERAEVERQKRKRVETERQAKELINLSHHPAYSEEKKYLDKTLDIVGTKMGAIKRYKSLGADDWANNSLSHFYASEYRQLYAIWESPYFGRVDISTNGKVEIIYVGEHSLHDKNSNLIVISWHSKVGELFYQRSLGPINKSPFGKGNVDLIRQIRIRKQRIEKIVDSRLGRYKDDAILEDNLSSQATVKMKKIIETIQREQDEIIRVDKNIPLVIQGSAGSGKTSMALTRIAYLFYNNSKMDPKQIIMFGPSKMYLEYISDVLPGLGLSGIIQTSFEEWALSILKIDTSVLRERNYFVESNYLLNELALTHKLKGSLEFNM